MGAQFVAFAIAFAVIPSYWLTNHPMVASFAALDTPTIVVHLSLLAAVVLLPFTTEAVGDPEVADLPLPTVMMAVSIAAVSVLHTLGLGDRQPPWPARSQAHRGRASYDPGRRARAGSGLLISIPIAYLASPGMARLSWLLLLVVNPVVGRLLVRRR